VNENRVSIGVGLRGGAYSIKAAAIDHPHRGRVVDHRRQLLS